MSVESVFFETDMAMEDFMAWLRPVLNFPTVNRTPQRVDQERDSVNHGGLYYLVEVLGFDLKLIRNAGETFVPEYPSHAFYLMISGGEGDGNLHLANHIRDVVARAGVRSVVEVD
ncbi:MAG: hypothetical protein OEO77_06820 [Acidimicrobiia bacterium]|nr:hypothetical protein [Acidimicrobiia bacterium]